eukprot:TRINITY_DN13072_c0_g1_i1.p1 TRINITY_DN13072_c0_g1~~TRINITY_DN13072_c0_g1_i1.p1  ORF type:complete len:468 (-),score=87.85 TRINITY_DN13072_c0_g1_i1:21-1424(-)
MKPPTETERKREQMEAEHQQSLRLMLDVVGNEVPIEKIRRTLHGANGNVERALNHLYSEVSPPSEPQSPSNPTADSLHALLLTVAEEVKCPLCLTYFTQPVILPSCNHAFCTSCLESVVNENQVVCPLCRKTCRLPEGGLKSIQRNTTLSNIVDTLRKAQAGRSTCEKCTKNPCLYFCYECQSTLCDGCNSMIHSVQSCRLHRRVPSDEYFLPRQDKSEPILEWIVPSEVPQSESLDCFNAWVKSLWFLPADFRMQLRLDNFKAIYVPYWCFNVDSESKYSGTVTFTHGSQIDLNFGDSGILRESRWPSDGTYEKSHGKLVTPGTTVPDPEILHSLEPWDLSVMERLTSSNCGNFETKSCNISSERALAKIKEQVEKVALDDCHAKLSRGRGTVSNLKVETTCQVQPAMKVYVPVLYTTYRYQHRNFHFAINANSRKCFGQRPFVFSNLRQRALGTVGAALGLLRPY